eukprot:GHVP01019209.1.p1 GENE.GHVP01019209.1~~GHVP01019209.1.p1  ORF type:complete len:248 (+),score=26.08 GHVP01019209.1:67-810(+)
MLDFVERIISIHRGDIFKVKASALVNPTNKNFSGSGGLDKVVHQKAGMELTEAVRPFIGLEKGEAIATEAYNLDFDYIVHVVSPTKTDPLRVLTLCYCNALRVASSRSCASIVFPCIGTGQNSIPPIDAARVAIGAVVDWVGGHKDLFEKVIFCVADEQNEALYSEFLHLIIKEKKIHGYIPENSKDEFRKTNPIREDRVCAVCLDALPGCVFDPCGHLVCCEDCASRCSVCPVCKSAIKKSLKIYM